MGLRGPTPVDLKRLQDDAEKWTCFFYTLRDGQPGYMERVRWGRSQSYNSAVAKGVKGLERCQPSREFRGVRVTPGQYLERPRIVRVSEAATATEKMIDEGWVLVSAPILPAPEIWEQLKMAMSVAAIKKASRAIHRHWNNEQIAAICGVPLDFDPIDFPDALARYADKILIAKELPNYPKAKAEDRPSSDDKRVEFFSKILAGAGLGIAPITAAKRLAHRHWTREWSQKLLQGPVESWSGETLLFTLEVAQKRNPRSKK
jgi:hypothetical protein